MEAKVIVATELQLKAFIADAVDAAFRYHTLQSTTVSPPSARIGFKAICEEYFPGVPHSTVRQLIANLPKTLVGKRILVCRKDVELLLQNRQKTTARQIEAKADEYFAAKHCKPRKGGDNDI